MRTRPFANDCCDVSGMYDSALMFLFDKSASYSFFIRLIFSSLGSNRSIIHLDLLYADEREFVKTLLRRLY